MERFDEVIDGELIELGVASEETKGGIGVANDVASRQPLGLTED